MSKVTLLSCVLLVTAHLVSAGLTSRLVMKGIVDVFTAFCTSATVTLKVLRAASTTLKLHCGVINVGTMTSFLKAK